MNDPLILKARLTRGGDKIKIRWTPPSDEMPSFEYLLQREQLKARVDACCQALNALQGVADVPNEEGLSEALRGLRLSGEELYRVLMSGAGGKTPAAQAFRTWFEDTVGSTEPGTWRVEFQHEEPLIAVPWGLTCAPGSISGDGTAFDDYMNLWAHRYTATSSIGASDSAYGEPTQIEGGFQCSLLLEVSSPPEAPRFQLQVADHDGGDMTMWVNAPLLDHTINRVSALRGKFRARYDWNHIVYLNLHAAGDHFSFPNDEEKLTPDELQRIKSLLDTQRHTIVMIDREGIIRGDRGQAWLETFFNEQWAGLIAAETDITAQNLRFRGFRFLMELLSRGVRLTESLVEVRRLLWPYSLLYGVYSNPDRLFVSPAPDFVKELLTALEKHE